MKRFVVIITSLLILFVFIALNYLLWDRESLVTQGENNQASIEALTRMNMTLNQEKNSLEQHAAELKQQILGLEDKIKEISAELSNQKRDTDEKVKFIIDMKEHINPKPVETMVLEWVSSINEKKYSEAYLKGGENCSFWGNTWPARIFSNYFDENVEQIQFVRDGESQPVIEVVPIKTPDWEMSVYVRVHVTLKEGADQAYLKPGGNVLHITCTYAQQLDQWTITSIFSEEATLQESSDPGEPRE